MTDATDVVAPPERGKTTISERVLRKIAEYDAGRHHGVVATRRVRARHHDRHVDIRMGLTLAYPMPAAETAHGVRLRVMSALRRFTGYEVTDVDIVVSYERR
ncbi:MAG: Asp23/Gls24 family envelope stress response protein [Mycobacteriales bacterium]